MQQQASSVHGSKPFFRAVLPLPPGINQSYKIVSVHAKRTQVERAYIKGQLRVSTDQPDRRVNRLGASEALEMFKQEAERLLNMSAVIDRDVLGAICAQKRRKTELQVAIMFYYPTLWRHDIDGGVKAVLDACFAHMGINDNQVCRLIVEKRADRDEPRVEVEVSCLVGR